LSSDLTSQSANDVLSHDMDDDSLMNEEERSVASSAPGEIISDEQGRQMQRFVLDGVEILVPLPSDTAIESVCGEEADAMEELPPMSGKRK
jgi:hypothetical protein